MTSSRGLWSCPGSHCSVCTDCCLHLETSLLLLSIWKTLFSNLIPTLQPLWPCSRQYPLLCAPTAEWTCCSIAPITSFVMPWPHQACPLVRSLCFLFPGLVTYSLIFACLLPSHCSALCTDVTFSERPFQDSESKLVLLPITLYSI